MTDKFIIYGLIDPRTKLIRYVGRSSSGLRRPSMHWASSVKIHTWCARWICSLRSKGLRYEIAILETVETQEQLGPAEIWWIVSGRAMGWPLTNHSDGGGGINRKFSDEHRARISSAKKGVPKSPEHRAAIAAVRTGTKAPSDVRKRMSEAHKARYAEMRKHGWRRVISDEQKAKSRAKAVGRKDTTETLLRKKEAGRRRWARERAAKQPELPGISQLEAA